MRSTWQLKDFSGDFIVARWRPRSAEAKDQQYMPDSAVISRWLQGMRSRQMALEMYEAAYGHAPREMTGFDDIQLARRLEEAFRRRKLICLRVLRKLESGNSSEIEASSTTPPPPPPPPRRSTKPTTWIAIELVDDQGKPIPRERFRIELPDGSFVEGQLDAGGRARLDDLDPGTCQITFPDMDAKEWKPA
jgi:hypothetical protein